MEYSMNKHHYVKPQKDGPDYLLDSWRSAWSDNSLPFYYVPIASHNYSKWTKDRIKYKTGALPEFWDAQTEFMKRVPNTAMAVTTDLVDYISDIHPSYKWIVGESWPNKHLFSVLKLSHPPFQSWKTIYIIEYYIVIK